MTIELGTKLIPDLSCRLSTRMTTETFSRAYLQGLPEQYKQQYISGRIAPIVQEIMNLAVRGETSYMYVMPAICRPVSPVITETDIVAALRLKFPDCTVSYQESWVDTNSSTRTLKKGIVIDWA